MTTRKTPATARAVARKTPAAAKTAAKKTPVQEVPDPGKAPAKKPKKGPKVKVVRDSFTMPQSEYQKIAEIKEACLKAGLPVKKSEVLRAGLKALGGMNAAQLKRTLTGLEKIKTGRPKKH